MNAESILMRDPKLRFFMSFINLMCAKLLQKSEMRKDIVIELSYKGFG